MSATMKALRVMSPRQVNVGQVERPQYGADEVLIKVHYVGVCATDLEIYQGEMVYYQTGQASYPIIPGHEWSGEVVATGSEVKGLAVGDRVVGETTISCGRCQQCMHGQYNLCPHRVENGVMGKDGACAEYMVYPAHALHKFSAGISYEEAALIEPAAVAYRGVDKLKVTPADTVAVLGAGPIGLLAAQIAQSFGAKKVVLIDMRKNRLEMGLSLGCDAVIDLSTEDLVERANEMTNGAMFDAIIEATGHTKAVENITQMTAPGSRVVLLGLCGGRKACLDVDHIVTHDVEMYGSLASPGVWADVIELMESGKLRTKDLITHRFALSEIESAFKIMEDKDPSIVKMILEL